MSVILIGWSLLQSLATPSPATAIAVGDVDGGATFELVAGEHRARVERDGDAWGFVVDDGAREPARSSYDGVARALGAMLRAAPQRPVLVAAFEGSVDAEPTTVATLRPTGGLSDRWSVLLEDGDELVERGGLSLTRAAGQLVRALAERGVLEGLPGLDFDPPPTSRPEPPAGCIWSVAADKRTGALCGGPGSWHVRVDGVALPATHVGVEGAATALAAALKLATARDVEVWGRGARAVLERAAGRYAWQLHFDDGTVQSGREPTVTDALGALWERWP